MSDLNERISRADKPELDELLKAVLARHRVLFPDWEISVITLHRNSDRNAQLDGIISVLQTMKHSPIRLDGNDSV